MKMDFCRTMRLDKGRIFSREYRGALADLNNDQSRLGRRNPSADSLVAYICSFAYWIPFAHASSPLLKLSRHNPDDFF